MGTSAGPLPHWSWDDLETALDQLGSSQHAHTLREHMLRRLKLEAGRSTPVELLASLLSTAVLVAQTPSSGTGLHHEDRSFG